LPLPNRRRSHYGSVSIEVDGIGERRVDTFFFTSSFKTHLGALDWSGRLPRRSRGTAVTRMLGNEPLTIYASRAKTGGFALLFAVMVALAVVAFDRDPTNGRMELGLSLFGTGLLFMLYWALTPVPLLLVDETRLVFQRWPLIRRTIAWADVASLMAFKRTFFVYGRHTIVTLQVRLKPHAVAAYGNRQQLNVAISQVLLPIPVEELVRLLRRYHRVTYERHRSVSDRF
jgi:hypothetical protein